MIDTILILMGKFVSAVSRLLNLGNGSTWPGHIALSLNNNFIREITKKNNFKIILIAGTNGKTTTAKLIKTIFENNNITVFQNESGANLVNGIASSLILNSSIFGKIKKDFAIFETDENTLPLVLKELAPDYLVLLDLFRDQLDRYGEVDSIAKKWRDTIRHLPLKTTLILNADDPLIAYLSKNSNIKSIFFGLNDKNSTQTIQHSRDSIYCPNCNSKLSFSSFYFSHIGIWGCTSCGLKRPKPDVSSFGFYPLSGIYNKYNIHASVLTAKIIGIPDRQIVDSLKLFKPVFGRGEKIKIGKKNVQLFLSKNPTSFNESLRTIASLSAKKVLLALNDRIPDGRDVSWIWDIELEEYINNFSNIIVSGDRCYDMALRTKYALKSQNSNLKTHTFDKLSIILSLPKDQSYSSKFRTIENLNDAIKEGLKLTKENEALYILPTYSAMLEVRKILTGKKIL